MAFEDGLGHGPGSTVVTAGTGWRATHAIAVRFPEAFLPNSVGTRFECRAAAAPAAAG